MPKPDPARLPFEGIKVADFSWVGVGPITARYLGDYGATVVRIESSTRIETLRRANPYKDNVPGVDRSGFFAMFNASKYGITLNLNHPRGPGVAQRLIAWADVLVESFTPGTMARWGLDYDNARKINPGIIYCSTCQMGQTGPWTQQPGYGTQLVSLSGFTDLTGWPDRDPAGPYGAYTDFINPPFAVAAIAAALDHRRRTGKGQRLDQSQLECGLQFLAPWLLDYMVNGRAPVRQGNRDPYCVPHNVYPCRGNDRWVAIAVTCGEEWQALCSALGAPEWTGELKFNTVLGRKAHEAELDELIGQWTRRYTAEQVMSILQAVGVPAGVVESSEDLHKDPQLAQRGHFVYLEHPVLGKHSYDQFSVRLSRTPGGPRSAAPCLGQHNQYVYKELLGYTDEEMAELAEQGVME